MSCYQKMAAEVKNLLKENKLPYEDTIMIGDNSSGKSEILYQLVKENLTDKFYFIDAVNRYFNLAQISPLIPDDIMFSTEINKYRLEPNKFNLEDSFYYKGMPRAIEDFYLLYEAKLQDMMSRFLDITFEVRHEITGWLLYLDGTEAKLSSGYQALLRVFLELMYYTSNISEGTVIIDEIDEFLSANNSSHIYNFLISEFPSLHFIITTHSADLISVAEKANLIVLRDGEYEILDVGDFDTVSQVYNIFKKTFQRNPVNNKQSIDWKLRKLFNNKMAGVWNAQDEESLTELEKEDLSKAQKVLLRQIRE